MQLQLLKEVLPAKTKVFAISAFAKKGLDDMLYDLKKVVNTKKAKKVKDEDILPVIRLGEEKELGNNKS